MRKCHFCHTDDRQLSQEVCACVLELHMMYAIGALNPLLGSPHPSSIHPPTVTHPLPFPLLIASSALSCSTRWRTKAKPSPLFVSSQRPRVDLQSALQAQSTESVQTHSDSPPPDSSASLPSYQPLSDSRSSPSPIVSLSFSSSSISASASFPLLICLSSPGVSVRVWSQS